MTEKKMNIYEKLLAIQSELKAPKNQFNSFGKYKYRSCEDILEAVKPLCKKYKVLLTIADEIVQKDNRYYLQSIVGVHNCDNPEEKRIWSTGFARECEAKKGMDESQITGSASSYARKYALNGLFSIDDTKDADTQNNSNVPKPEKKTYLNPKFLKEMKTMREILGDEKYYELLHKHNYEHSNNIPPKSQAAALKAFNSLVDTTEGKGN